MNSNDQSLCSLMLSAKNAKLSTLSGFRHDLLSVPIFPPQLNTLSAGTLVAHILSNFLAS